MDIILNLKMKGTNILRLCSGIKKKSFFFILAILPMISLQCSLENWENLGKDLIVEKDGNITSIFHPKDVISYTRHMFDESFLVKLQDSYNGLDDEKKLFRLLTVQDYIEILHHVWTEKDLTKRIRWLEKESFKGHPILMLELAKAYFLNSPTLETYVKKSLPWLKTGQYHIKMDALCTSDPSTAAAAGVSDNYEKFILHRLINTYSNEQIQSYYIENIAFEFLNYLDIQRKILIAFMDNRIATVPSPSWVFYHGLYAFLSQSNEIPESEWETIRQNQAFERLEEIYIAENEYKYNQSELLKNIRELAEENYQLQMSKKG